MKIFAPIWSQLTNNEQRISKLYLLGGGEGRKTSRFIFQDSPESSVFCGRNVSTLLHQLCDSTVDVTPHFTGRSTGIFVPKPCTSSVLLGTSSRGQSLVRSVYMLSSSIFESITPIAFAGGSNWPAETCGAIKQFLEHGFKQLYPPSVGEEHTLCHRTSQPAPALISSTLHSTATRASQSSTHCCHPAREQMVKRWSFKAHPTHEAFPSAFRHAPQTSPLTPQHTLRCASPDWL